LAALHAQVFQVLYGASGEYGSVQDLWGNNEFMGETGTHTILDVGRVVHSEELPEPGRIDDYGTLRPLRRERILYHFGTDRPTVGQFEQLLVRARAANRGWPDFQETLLDECKMRWTGLYVELYSDDTPSHLGIFGFSGD
jgi:hypothetical protein